MENLHYRLTFDLDNKNEIPESGNNYSIYSLKGPTVIGVHCCGDSATCLL